MELTEQKYQVCDFAVMFTCYWERKTDWNNVSEGISFVLEWDIIHSCGHNPIISAIITGHKLFDGGSDMCWCIFRITVGSML